MAINKVVYGETPIIDLTDTTAEASDVALGEVFYNNAGVRTLGTGNYMDKASNPTANDILVTDANGQAIDSGVDIVDVVQFTDVATDNDYGVVKTNASQNITLDASGRLEVGGRIGQFPNTTGLFAPNNRAPRDVKDYSFLITDAMGMELSTTRAFAVVSGLGTTCKSAAAGTTEYHVSNTYANRISCKIAENGYASRDEATSQAELIIPVVSVTIDGQPYTPESAPDDPTKDIVITTQSTLNPDSAITNIRLFGKMTSYSTAHLGNGIASWGGGRNLFIGGGVTKDGSGNDNCVVANAAYVNGNGNGVFGRWHIARKNRGFLAGSGHDTTNAKGEGVSAVGVFSLIDATTLFAVGNGTSATNRSNAFEVTDKNGGTAKVNFIEVNFIEANNGKLEFASTQDIAPSVNTSNWGLGTGGSIVDYEGTLGFATTDVKGTAVNITAATGVVKPVTAGETLQWSFKARKKTGSETGKLQLNLLKCNSTGGSTSNNIVHDGTATSYTTEWVTYSGSFTVPSGMEYVRPRFARTNTGAGSSGGYEIKDFTLIQAVDSGVVLTSPNGTKYKIAVDNSGNLTTVAV